MSEHSQILGEAIAQLHQVFSSTSKAGESLRGLTLEALIRQMDEAADAGILRQILPHALEKFAENAHRACFDKLSICLQKAEWRAWAREEQIALETFFRAQWQAILHENAPTGTESLAYSFLSALNNIMDIQPLLDIWLNNRAAHTVAHMASVAVYGKHELSKLELWLAQGRVLQRVEAAFWDCHSDEQAALFSKAAEYLRSGDKLLA